MRFVRNLALKEHLNSHFLQNLALKRRADRVNIARDQFQGFQDFIAPRKHIIKQDGKYLIISLVQTSSALLTQCVSVIFR